MLTLLDRSVAKHTFFADFVKVKPRQAIKHAIKLSMGKYNLDTTENEGEIKF
jgi:hypothetical protein